MSPSYNDGDYCLALPLPRGWIRPGQIVLFEHPAYGLMIKRVSAADPNGIRVAGDAPASIAGADLGVIGWSDVRGRVLLRWPR